MGRDSGSCAVRPVMASSIRARSETLRAIGPSTHSVSNAGRPSPRGTTPGLGLIPTMAQKLAGILSEPPRQEPFASQTSCAANDAAAPPEEPPAVKSSFQGLRVTPHTGLKVWLPANSGTFDFANGIAPLARRRATVRSSLGAMLVAKIGAP